jgi:DNA-binding transcriptional LysR family regulator
VSLTVVPVTDMLMPMLDRAEIDLGLGAAIETPARFVVEPLYSEKFVWIAAPGNALAC